MHGSGQGSGSSAPIWMFISSIIMDRFEEVAQGMTMTNINKDKHIQQCIDGYVVDTSIFTSLTETTGHTPPSKEVARKLQEDAQIWTELLAATGGKLELTKCFYYVLHWKFDNEGVASHMTKAELEEPGVQIRLIEPGEVQATETEITHHDCSTAHWTLGMQKTPIGNQDEQLKKLQEKSNQIAQAVKASLLSQTEAMAAWKTMYIPAVAYPTVATYFQEADLTNIKNKALMVFLPKMGYSQHTARAVVYGPEECGRIGIKNLYVEQSIKQIKALKQHTGIESPLGTS
jgi:hypothetical protein